MESQRGTKSQPISIATDGPTRPTRSSRTSQRVKRLLSLSRAVIYGARLKPTTSRMPSRFLSRGRRSCSFENIHRGKSSVGVKRLIKHAYTGSGLSKKSRFCRVNFYPTFLRRFFSPWPRDHRYVTSGANFFRKRYKRFKLSRTGRFNEEKFYACGKTQMGRILFERNTTYENRQRFVRSDASISIRPFGNISFDNSDFYSTRPSKFFLRSK